MIDISTALDIWPFDVEVYRNFFSFSAKNHTTKKKISFVICPWKDEKKKLVKFVKTEGLILAGYNNHSYDNIILNYILKFGSKLSAEELCQNLFDLSQRIINRVEGDSEIIELQYRFKAPYYSIDLMRLHAFHKVGVGLKQVGISLKHSKLQDLPIHWSTDIKPEDEELIISYNFNDVDITDELFETSKKELLLRQEISQNYSVDVMSADRSKIANLILEYYYEQQTGIPKAQFKELRTHRKEILVGNIVSDKLEFRHPILVKFFEDLKLTSLKPKWNPLKKKNTFQFKYSLKFGGKTYDIGVGGLHSKDDPRIIEEGASYEIIDADVGSFYPNIMLNEKVKPAHLGNEFLTVLRMITEERLKAKELQAVDPSMKIKQEALKITINSIFGKLGSEFFWLFDQSALFAVTINGQLFLLSLIDKFVNAGIEVLSANTDGVTCKVYSHQKEKYEQICQQWSEHYEFKLEFAHYSKIIRRDVNNYLAIKKGKDLIRDEQGLVDIKACIDKGIIKVKGCFEPEIKIDKGYRHPVIPQAYNRYFLDGIDPEETIRSHQDIYDFLLSQKTRDDFDTQEFQVLDGEMQSSTLQKNNRFYVSNSGSSIVKKNKEDGRVISLVSGETLTLLNDVDDSPIEERDIDYNWYIKECWKVIDKIEPKIQQMSLLDLIA